MNLSEHFKYLGGDRGGGRFDRDGGRGGGGSDDGGRGPRGAGGGNNLINSHIIKRKFWGY